MVVFPISRGFTVSSAALACTSRPVTVPFLTVVKLVIGRTASAGRSSVILVCRKRPRSSEVLMAEKQVGLRRDQRSSATLSSAASSSDFEEVGLEELGLQAGQGLGSRDLTKSSSRGDAVLTKAGEPQASNVQLEAGVASTVWLVELCPYLAASILQ